MLKNLIRILRILLWRILGVNYLNVIRAVEKSDEVRLKKIKWVKIGHRSYDNGADAYRYSDLEGLEIGKFCSIARQVIFLCGSGKHDMSLVSTYPIMDRFFDRDEIVSINGVEKRKILFDPELAKSHGSIKVGNDVWIGYRAIIQSGVTINDGVVILPGAIVTRDVPAYAVVGGIPGKILRYRFSDDIICELLLIKWWDWSDELIKARIAEFYGPIDTFIRKYQVKSA